MSAPMVPQRPVRSQDTSSTADPGLEIPQIPPRPARSTDRSVSPSRLEASRSPLNSSPFASNVPVGGGLSRPTQRLSKPPSVASLPLIGQEGMEYASFDSKPAGSTGSGVERPDSPNETRNISRDLPMHAPKASISSSAAESQVAPMTRMDSNDVAGAGIGKPRAESDEGDMPSRLREYRPSSSQSRDLTRSVSRPESFHSEEHDHGIPAIGLQVPMYPNAGDVQAPSPGPSQYPPSTGVGFFNSGAANQTYAGRRRSSLGFTGPPGSYGLHGHGVVHKDQFEKTWYQKHPEELSKEEQGAYGPSVSANRSQWAMSSDDLNKLVRESANRNAVAAATAPPDEDFGYKLSENYSRDASPQLRAVKSRTESQTYAESPLRRAINAEDVHDAHAFDSENEDDHLHLGPPRNISTPALASDEVSKGSNSPWAQPAVSPAAEKANDEDYFASISRSPTHSRSGRSRPNSRPASARFHQHDFEGAGTPLDEIEEYEPLFNDEEDEPSEKRPLTAADRLRRPELERRFPSLDIWEDTPTSLQLHTTVSGPQEPEEVTANSTRSAAMFESPEQEQARKGEVTEAEKVQRLQDPNMRLSKPKFKPGLEEETRPAIQRRFPSLDVWEDSPSSLQLVTTIDEAEARDRELTSPTGANAAQEKPVVPLRPARTKAAEATQAQPSIPPRPVRAKPQVPARPSKTSQDDGDGSSLSKSISAGSTGSIELSSPTDRSVGSSTATKSKPTVPSKPQAGSSKFASIKAGFMNDLNSRLQQGPSAKKPEPEPAEEEEKAPLTDARKSRAKGPARRKPAEPSSSESAAPSKPSSGWSIVHPMNMWSISNMDGDDVIVGAPASASGATRSPPAEDTSAQSKPTHIDLPAAEIAAKMTPAEREAPVSPLATNTAGESLSKPTVEYPEPQL